jgi:ABC-2 type transport system permease protein
MPESLRRIGAVAAKELRHLRRDELSRAMILGIPLVMTLLFGYAINHDVRHLPAAVVDQAETSASRLLLAKIQASRVVDIVERYDSVAALEQSLAQGAISVGIFVPADFERRVSRRDRPIAQLLIDGSDPVVQSAAKSLQLLPLLEGERAGTQSATGFELRVYYNPERRSPVFIVPGLTGVILNLTMVLFTAVAIVRERERGNMELLITTPISGLELMLGKILPYMVIGYLQAGIIMALGVWLFDVPIAGSLLDFAIGVGLFIIATLSLGLMISTFASNQFQAFQMTFMTFLPQMLLSGFMFPFEGMPIPAQWLAELFPLTHFLRIVRGIVLREADLLLLWQDVWPLLLFFLVFLTAATLRFQKRLD